MTKELCEQMQLNNTQNGSLGKNISELIHQNRNVQQLRRRDIRNQLVNYSDKGRMPHARSQTAMGRRSELPQLPMNKSDPNYEPLMEKIQKWQMNLRKYSTQYVRYQELKTDILLYLPTTTTITDWRKVNANTSSGLWINSKNILNKQLDRK